MLRSEVENLVKLGQLPGSKSGIPVIQAWQQALERIAPPVSNEEAEALTALFPAQDDECFGLAWTLVHLVETAPSWPLRSCLQGTANPWMVRLRNASGLTDDAE